MLGHQGQLQWLETGNLLAGVFDLEVSFEALQKENTAFRISTMS